MNWQDMNHDTRVYRVRGYGKPAPGSHYARHVDIGVVASSATSALAIAAARHPDVRFDSVNNNGAVHAIDGALAAGLTGGSSAAQEPKP